MCGVFGVVLASVKSVPDQARLARSRDSLFHRGPDAGCLHAEPGAGFAHTRLSFVDTDARSNQPFWDRKGRHALIFNGEIYNFRQLRAQLEAEGVEFRTSSDTEVLLEMLLHRDPVTALRALEGMFAFALYDREERTLLLARDRFGMKPLYVHESPDCVVFASEPKALRPWIPLRADALMIGAYLLNYRGPTAGPSFFADVQALPPGTMLSGRAGSPLQAATFARLEDFMQPEALEHYGRQTPDQVVDHVDELLGRSVESHLLADVPVGAFCSGGVDSSLLMAMAARRHGNLAIFHANVKGRWSEYGAAAALAKHLKLEMRAVDVEEQDFLDFTPRAIAHFEQPFADRPNCVPMMLVAELARDSGVKGLLSGEGSDECFLGYPWLGRKRIVDAYNRVGHRLGTLVRRIPGLGDLLWPATDTSATFARDLMTGREVATDNDRIRGAVASMRPQGAGNAQLWTLEYLHHHLRILLHRNDTMGMVGSIESRFPFLDHSVVRAAVNMPLAFKLRRDLTVLDKAHPFLRDKWVVRQVADRYMPSQLSQRNKFGFWTTVFDRTRIDPVFFHSSWISNFLGLTNAQFDTAFSEMPPRMHLRLLHLDLWGRICIEAEPQEASVERLRNHARILPEAA